MISKNIPTYKLRTLGLGFMSLFSMDIAAQSGWTKEKTEGFYQLSFQSMKSDKYYSINGNLLETNQFS